MEVKWVDAGGKEANQEAIGGQEACPHLFHITKNVTICMGH